MWGGGDEFLFVGSGRVVNCFGFIGMCGNMRGRDGRDGKKFFVGVFLVCGNVREGGCRGWKGIWVEGMEGMEGMEGSFFGWLG